MTNTSSTSTALEFHKFCEPEFHFTDWDDLIYNLDAHFLAAGEEDILLGHFFQNLNQNGAFKEHVIRVRVLRSMDASLSDRLKDLLRTEDSKALTMVQPVQPAAPITVPKPDSIVFKKKRTPRYSFSFIQTLATIISYTKYTERDRTTVSAQGDRIQIGKLMLGVTNKNQVAVHGDILISHLFKFGLHHNTVPLTTASAGEKTRSVNCPTDKSEPDYIKKRDRLFKISHCAINCINKHLDSSFTDDFQDIYQQQNLPEARQLTNAGITDPKRFYTFMGDLRDLATILTPAFLLIFKLTSIHMFGVARDGHTLVLVDPTGEEAQLYQAKQEQQAAAKQAAVKRKRRSTSDEDSDEDDSDEENNSTTGLPVREVTSSESPSSSGTSSKTGSPSVAPPGIILLQQASKVTAHALAARTPVPSTTVISTEGSVTPSLLDDGSGTPLFPIPAAPKQVKEALSQGETTPEHPTQATSRNMGSTRARNSTMALPSPSNHTGATTTVTTPKKDNRSNKRSTSKPVTASPSSSSSTPSTSTPTKPGRRSPIDRTIAAAVRESLRDTQITAGTPTSSKNKK